MASQLTLVMKFASLHVVAFVLCKCNKWYHMPKIEVEQGNTSGCER